MLKPFNHMYANLIEHDILMSLITCNPGLPDRMTGVSVNQGNTIWFFRWLMPASSTSCDNGFTINSLKNRSTMDTGAGFRDPIDRTILLVESM